MKRFKGLLALPALVAAGACAPPSQTDYSAEHHAGASPGAACWIEFREGSGPVQVESYVAPGLAGSYALEVRQASAGGDALINQSGPFAATDVPERNSQVTLGTNGARRGISVAEMMASTRNAEPGTTIISSGGPGVYHVRLRLMDTDGRQICAVERLGP